VDMAESNPEGSEWPTQVDILENDEQEETPEQTETDEHENAHMPAAMAKEIKEMISQEVAKAQVAALSHLKEYFANLLRGRAKEWWNHTLATKGPDVARNMSWNEFKESFLQKFSPRAELKNILRDFLSTHQATQQPVHDFSMTFLDRVHFLPEYVNDQKLLMNHYVDMLKKEIREFVSAKDWKNMDELMNAALEREQETKKHEQSPSKRRIKQGVLLVRSSSLMKPIQGSGGKDTHSVPIMENSIRTTKASKSSISDDDNRRSKGSTQSVMSSDSAITYTSVHSEARSWSILSEDPYGEAARQLLEQAPHLSEYVPDSMELEDHRRATTPSIYHSLLPAGTPPLLPIPLSAPSTSRRANIPEADTPPRKRLLLTAPTPRVEVGESSAAARQPGSTMARRVNHSFVDAVDTRVRDTERRTMAAVEVVNLRVSYQADVCRRESLRFYSRHQEAQEDRAAVRVEIEILRRERLAYEQESIETRQALARSEAYSRALEARIRVLETQVYCHEWQRQDADDCAIEHIIRTQSLKAGARVDTLEDTGSSA
ncbi:putative ribonuclease H-like domain-containing protein, partial [Tanacetum coccineum]